MQIDDRTERTGKTQGSPVGFDLLAACSYVGFSQQEEQVLKAAVSWDLFLALVRRHAVAPLVADRLSKLGGDLAPPEVMESLKLQAMDSWQRSMLLATALSRLLVGFSEAGIEAMPLKGNVLSSRLFGDPGMRQVSDIDVLVHESDLPAAHASLLSAGYLRTTPSRELTPKQERAVLRQAHHWTYRNEAVTVELHWRLFRWSTREIELLWSRANPYEWMGRTVLQPDDALLLLTLCDHGSQHRYSHLKWLADIATLLGSGRFDWPEVLRLANELDLELPLAQAALLIERVYPVPLPTELLGFAHGEKGAEDLADEALRCLFDSDARLLRPDEQQSGIRNLPYWFRRSVGLAGYWGRLRKRRSLASRLAPLAVGQADFEAFPLPDSLFWMYVAFRPVFWVIRFARGR